MRLYAFPSSCATDGLDIVTLKESLSNAGKYYAFQIYRIR